MDALRDNADVVVIGGGPTGSTAANILSKAGWRVLLIEKERFPRHHVGESLLPALDRLYVRLGVREALRRERFFLKRGGAFLWGRSRRLWSIDVTKAVPLVEKGGRFAYHVQRDRFDELLLQACRRRGARVVEGAAVVGLDV
ncbi:MAG: tryptophan 7-halogenase, partial [Elusimicrobia bacterium]|nr:tryptophan 7-halogenase [Elusimicrobiota bacterium]